MGAKQSHPVKDRLTKKQLQDLAKTTKISERELKASMEKFYREYPTGTLSKHQFISECLSLRGGKMEFWSAVFDQFDTDQSGTLDCREFLVALSVVSADSLEDKIKLVFKIFDKDGSGKISKKEWTTMVYYLSRLSRFFFSERENPLPLTLEHVDDFFVKFEAKGDGEISFEEFKEIVQKYPQLKVALTTWLDDEIVCASPSQRQKKALTEISFLLKDFFSDISVTDFSKGLILIHARQKQTKEKQKFTSSAARVPTDLPLKAWKYARWAGASYGWKMLHTFLSDLNYVHKSMQLIHNVILDEKANLTALVDYLGIDEKDIILAEWENDVFRPGHVIALNHPEKEIIVSIRGTISVVDVLTDLIANNAPLLDGYAHSGMLRAALWFMEIRGQVIRDTIKKYPDYKLQVVGHSLGAGVGALISILLKNEGYDLHCWAFSSPVILDPKLAEKYKDLITTFIYHNDFVPRLSMDTVNKLRDEIKEEVKSYGLITAISTIFGSPLPARISSSSPDLKDISSLSISPGGRRFGPSEKVVIPGRLYHIGANGKPPNLKYVIFETTNARYDHIKLGRTMISDHMPDKYHDSFLGLMKQYPEFEQPAK